MLSTIGSMLTMRCPRCHQGKLFTNPNPYNLSMLSKMPEKCECCEQLFTPEPAFYYGAMYVSYFISIALSFINYFILEVAFGITNVWFLTWNAVILVILWPVIFRYARVFYIYLFVRYDKTRSKIN